MVYLILLCAVLTLTQADAGSLDMYLIFNDYCGDDRAYIWGVTAMGMSDTVRDNPIKTLIGYVRMNRPVLTKNG